MDRLAHVLEVMEVDLKVVLEYNLIGNKQLLPKLVEEMAILNTILNITKEDLEKAEELEAR